MVELTQRQLMLFWTQVQRGDGCWLWTGWVDPQGYGQFSVGQQSVRVHRLSYELLVGPIPDTLTLDHLCRVRNCVRPTHLDPVTNAENVLRGEGLTAVAARRDCCAHGHPYTVDNLYVTKAGTRQCRTCNRLKMRRRRAEVVNHVS